METERPGRGGGWVAAQFALMTLIVASWSFFPRSDRPLLGLIGSLLAIAGAAVVVWAWRTLGRSFTPFPGPAEGGELVTGGPFAHVRHPIYAGALAVFVGISLALGPGLLATAALALLWWRKAQLEERLLRARYPQYAEYAGRVRRRFLPGLI